MFVCNCPLHCFFGVCFEFQFFTHSTMCLICDMVLLLEAASEPSSGHKVVLASNWLRAIQKIWPTSPSLSTLEEPEEKKTPAPPDYPPWRVDRTPCKAIWSSYLNCLVLAYAWPGEAYWKLSSQGWETWTCYNCLPGLGWEDQKLLEKFITFPLFFFVSFSVTWQHPCIAWI